MFGFGDSSAANCSWQKPGKTTSKQPSVFMSSISDVGRVISPKGGVRVERKSAASQPSNRYSLIRSRVAQNVGRVFWQFRFQILTVTN